MSEKEKSVTRRGFLWGSSTALVALGALTVVGCRSGADGSSDSQRKNDRTIDANPPIDANPLSWWNKGGFVAHETVDTRRIGDGIISAYVDGSWRDFKVVDLPKRFMKWSLKDRLDRMDKMMRLGGMEQQDLAGSHSACVATYGGSPRDSAVSLNTAYKGLGFVVRSDILAETIQKIKEERIRIERDTKGHPQKEMRTKVRFLAEFYKDTSSFDRTKQVSLELFTSPDFQTHTFLNMMANPIASASFLAFPTFEIRAVPQLLHPENPALSETDKDMIVYVNAIHDFVHTGSGNRMACVYHIIEVFDDTPGYKGKGKRMV